LYYHRYAETLVASQVTRHSGINVKAIQVSDVVQPLSFFRYSRAPQEVCDGLNTVQSTLKTMYTLLPERIFFWLKADWTVISSLGVGLFSIATVVYNQVWLQAHELHIFPSPAHQSSFPANISARGAGSIRRWLSSRRRHSRLRKKHIQHVLRAMIDVKYT
jgi:hypothetical protein